MPRNMLQLLLFSGVLFNHAQSLSLDANSADSIKSAASSIAKVMVGYYNGTKPGSTPGLLDQPHRWWEGGALFDTLIDYWHYTGDGAYNDIVTQALLFHKGERDDYLPANQTKSVGTDDQDIWALVAMSAAESKLNDPPAGSPTWTALVEAVLDNQISRWDSATCGGGLRWQIFPFNDGYDFKDSASNGGFFQLAARYARYTNNQTYASWAEKVFDWSRSISLVDGQWRVHDGAQASLNCTPVYNIQSSYVAGMYTTGAAHMYNVTNGAAKWKTAVDGLLNNTLPTFFTNNVMIEVVCESLDLCTTDQKAFKGMTARWLAATAQMTPYTSALILPKLAASAQAAVKQCDADVQCGFDWVPDGSDAADTGLGQQMNALAVMNALLVGNAAAPATAATATGGGAAPGNSSSPFASPSASGAGATPSGTSVPSSASGLSLDGARSGIFLMLLAFLACFVL